MLSPDELMELYHTHQDDMVLSVYIDADQHDPAERDSWRIHLRHGMSAIGEVLSDRSRDEQHAFAAAKKLLEAKIEEHAGSFLSGRGWAGFATAGTVLGGHQVPAPLPDLVRWEHNLRIAPYIRAFKHTRPVFLVLLDRRKGHLYRYQGNQLEVLERLDADTFIGDLAEIEISKRPTSTSGVRGKTGTDAAKAILDKSAHVLIAKLIDELEQVADHAPLVVGGTREQIAAFQAALPPEYADRIVADASLNFDMSHAELAKYAGEAASRISSERIGQLVDELVDRSASGGRAVVGRDSTIAALREHRVTTLVLSERLQREDPDLADRLVGTAVGANGATAEIAPRGVGERLDEIGDGVGALLHYTIDSPDRSQQS
ncbi:MAG: hypothetical protein H0W15_00615 [Gemmatimonadales bacterium]|nr:hypothetical protein [Gemmatimonadales bacterium]